MTARIGQWMQSATGRKLWPLDPRPEDVHIEDIARALSRINRFGGHLPRHVEFISVAQHSVNVSRLCPPKMALLGLMHDATEAYLGDVVRALKHGLHEYKHLERQWAHAIGQRFGLGEQLVHLPPEVKLADQITLATEKRDLIGPGPAWDNDDDPDMEPATFTIHPWNPNRAEQKFLMLWEILRRGDE